MSGPASEFFDAAMLIDEIGFADADELLDVIEEARGAHPAELLMPPRYRAI